MIQFRRASASPAPSLNGIRHAVQRTIGGRARIAYLRMVQPDILVPLTAAAAIAAYGFYLRLL